MNWQDTLLQNGISSFDHLWTLNKDNWIEEPNYRRGGWSGVCKATLMLANGTKKNVFIKRQENHFYRGWKHFFLNRPTFEREYRNILSFKKNEIPTLDLIYFAHKVVDGNHRCILISTELENYKSLDEEGMLANLSFLQRKQVFASLASTLRVMHMKCYQHGNPYPKHVFVKTYPSNQVANGPTESCLIDLEKTRRRLFARSAAIKDLSIFHRHLNHVSKTNRLRFFLAYKQEKKLSTKSKKILAKILHKKHQKEIRV